MNELIAINTTNGDGPTVSGRELHTFLEVDTPYRIWFPRMTEYGFTEGLDWTPYNFVHPQNGQEATDHQLTIDMAKELCMIQRTEKGKQARQYFIEAERRLRTPAVTMTPLEMIATMAAEAAKHERMIQEQGRQIAAIADTASRAGAVIDAIRETVIADPAEWRKWINSTMAKIAQAIGEDEFRRLRTETYKILDDRARTNIKIRLENLRMRMAREGRSSTAINATNRMDIIEADPKLREIYTAIVKEFKIKYVDTSR